MRRDPLHTHVALAFALRSFAFTGDTITHMHAMSTRDQDDDGDDDVAATDVDL